jgi:hypothetical protein
MAQLQKGSTTLTQSHGLAIGYRQLGGVKSLQTARGREACTDGMGSQKI